MADGIERQQRDVAMPVVLLNTFEGGLDILKRTFQNLREAASVE
jgi:hypothetical protein